MANKKPNIIFFFTDDQRFDTIHALNNEHIITPTMDALVQRGTAFTHAHIMGGSCGAVCMPSRAMVITGRTLFRIAGEGQNIPVEHEMMFETFKRNGYTTFGTGKWHNGTASYARSFTHGAEIFFGGMDDHWNVPVCDFRPDGNYPEPKEHLARWHLGRPLEKHYNSFDRKHENKHSSELFCDAVINFLKSYREEKPFFIYLPFMAPHDPRTMPEKYKKMYDPDKFSLPDNFMPQHPFDNGNLTGRDEELAAFPRDRREIRQHLADYYAMITHLDAEMGRVVKVLEDTGQLGNTIMVLAGDNGLALGQHGLMGKQNVYEHAVRVPLVFAGPGIPPGQTRNAYCYLLDIYPTLCEMAGAAIPATVEGKSLVKAIGDGQEKVRDYLHLAYRDVQRAVKDRRYKLIEYVVQGKRTTQLFDLEADPLELHNLAGSPEQAARAERLRRELVKWRDELGDARTQGETFWKGYRKTGLAERVRSWFRQ